MRVKEIVELTEKEISRFWPKVDIKGEDECWLWKNKWSGDDYGTFTIYRNNTEITYRSHRVSLYLKTGIQGDVARHSCDTPLCCNPKHLDWGTIQDNMDDMIKRNRQVVLKGSRHGMAKVNESDVIRMRNDYSNGLINRHQLSELFGMTVPAIMAIINRRTWKHI